MSMTESPVTPGPEGRPGGAALGDLRDRMGSAAGSLTSQQKTRIAMVFVAVVGGVVAWSLVNQTPFTPLMTGLDAADAATVTQQLAASGYEYQLADNGSTIEVPADVADQARLDVASAGMPSSGKVGYAILDDQSLTASEFSQRVGFQRAMEGELASTIEAIVGVDAATVHLAIPRSDAFVLDEQQASASVMVRMAKGKTLGARQVQAVVNLVGSAVEGLSADRVTVADAEGNVLAAPGGVVDNGGAGSDANAAYEGRVASAIEAMLANVAGPGRAKATVSAELDNDAKSIQTETLTTPSTLVPNTPVALSETNKTETYNGEGTGAGTEGILGPDGQPNTGDETAAGTDYQSSETTRTNAFDKTVETTNKAPGTVKRLSVAVVVDEDAVTEEQVATIEGLVAAAAGIDPARGDTVQVSRLPYDEAVQEALQAELEAKPSTEEGLPVWIYGAAGVGLLALVGMALMLKKKKRAGAEPELLALPAGDDEPIVTLTATPRRAPAEALVGARAGDGVVAVAEPGTERREILGELIDNQPDEVAQLLRSWLGDRREVTR